MGLPRLAGDGLLAAEYKPIMPPRVSPPGSTPCGRVGDTIHNQNGIRRIMAAASQPKGNKMEVRRLKGEDIPAIIRLGGQMHRESQYNVLAYDPEKVAALCFGVMQDVQTMCYVAVRKGEVVGMVAGYLDNYAYGSGIIVKDMLIYVDPEHRGGSAFLRLAMRYIDWARDKCADLVFLSQTTGVSQKKVTKAYTGLGFEHVGGIFRKNLAQHMVDGLENIEVRQQIW